MKRAITLLIVIIMVVAISACTSGGGQDIFGKTYRWKDFIDNGLLGADIDAADEEFSTLVGYQEPIIADDIITDDDGIQYVKNRVNVTFANNTSGQEISDIIQRLDAEVVGYIAGMSMYQIKLNNVESEADLTQAIAVLEENEAVLVAMKDEIVAALMDGPSDPWEVPIEKDVVWDESNPDGTNWNVEAIKCLSAWQYKDQMQNVKVGVVDGGFDFGLEDLKIAEEKALDFYKIFNNTRHGTHVSGIIGATFDNGIGITGVAPNAELYVVNMVDSFSIELCIKWLVMIKKVKIINVSMGHKKSKKHEQEGGWLGKARYNQTLYIERLAEHNDFLIICASGNIEMDTKYQGMFSAVENGEAKKHILTVSSMGINQGELIPGNNTAYGENVDLFAPGEDVLSTYPNNKYIYLSGSSQAAPHATGVAAMVLGINPDLTCSEVREIILNSANETLPYHDRNIKMLNAKSAVESAIASLNGDAVEDSTQLWSTDIQVDARYIEFSNQNIDVDLVYPVISGMEDNELENSINAYIAGEIESLAYRVEQVDEHAGYGVGFFYATAYFTVERNDGDFLSIRLQIFNHTDNDYLNYSRYINIPNTTSCEQLELADIFIDGSNYIPVLNEKIEALITQEYWSEEYYFDSITDDQGFYLTYDSLGIVFPVRTIASFEYYEPEFEIPLAELSDMLRPDLRVIDSEQIIISIGGYTSDTWDDHEFYGIREADGGYYMLCNVQEYAKLSYEEYERLASGEIVDTVAGTLQYDGEDDEERIYFSSPYDFGTYYYIWEIPKPGEPEMLYWEFEYPVSYIAEEKEFFVPDNTYVYSPDHLHGHYIQKSFEDYINYGGTYEGYWTGRLYAWISGDRILRLEEEYES